MPTFFGQYLLEKGSLTREQLLTALDRQRLKAGKLGELAVKSGYLKPEDVALIRAEQQRTDLFFGEIAVKLGLLSEAKVKQLLNLQRSNHVFLGEILVELGYLSREAVEAELKKFREQEQEWETAQTVSIPPGYPQLEILKAVADLAPKHFRRVADMQVKVSKVSEEKDPVEAPHISVFIDIKGDFKGSILLKLSKNVAVQVSRVLIGNLHAEADDDLIRDAVSEFFNIFCGNLMTKFMEAGKSCEITVPHSFVDGEQKNIKFKPNARAFVIPLFTPEGFASVTVIPMEK